MVLLLTSLVYTAYAYDMPPAEQTPQNQTINPSTVTPPPLPDNHPNQVKKDRKPLILIIVGLIVLGLIAGGYYLGTKKAKPAAVSAPAVSEQTSIELPKDATVTAECEAGRGKQYILPKDIPGGPIYDVHEGKVVALEYLVGLNELTTSMDKFSNLLLKNVKYDHITIMPTDPHAGFNEQHIHVIAATMTKADMDAIKCQATDSSSTDMTHMH